MKVFISWSGNRSHKIAEMLHDWLSLVIQALEPWVSSSDIERGSQWNTKINKELESSSQGIFCLTAENKEAPWILFEAGSLAKGQDTSRVYTLLIDIKPSDITGPLVQFNHTQPTKTEMRLLVSSLNARLGDGGLSEAVLNRSFENAWPKFEADLKQIMADTEATTPIRDSRGDKEILGEILELVRNFDKRIGRLEKETSSSSLTDKEKYFFDSLRGDLNTRRPNLAPSTKAVVVRPGTFYGGGEPDPVLSEIWNSLKEGLTAEEIAPALMGSPHFLTSEQAAEQILRVRMMLSEKKQ